MNLEVNVKKGNIGQTKANSLQEKSNTYMNEKD